MDEIGLSMGKADSSASPGPAVRAIDAPAQCDDEAEEQIEDGKSSAVREVTHGRSLLRPR